MIDPCVFNVPVGHSFGFNANKQKNQDFYIKENPSTIKNSAIKMIYSTTEAPTAKTYRKPVCSNSK